MPDLEKMTLSDLKILAKENNIKNISKLKNFTANFCGRQ